MKTAGVIKSLVLGIGCASLMFGVSCKRSDVNDLNTLEVRLTDNPGNYAALNLSIERVDAYRRDGAKPNGGEWVTLSNESQSFNMLNLTNGRELILSSRTDMEAGVYAKLRLVFGDRAVLVFNADADIPGIDLDADHSLVLDWVGPRTVEVEMAPKVMMNNNAEVLLDFDVMHSIIQSNTGFAIDPQLSEIKDEETGLSGSVAGCAYAMVTADNSTESASTAIDASGRFLLRGISAGTYRLTVYPGDDDNNSAAHEVKVVENIVVQRGEITNVGVLELD